ncbi:2-dehydropantoate 2-reductase [Sphingosinicella sp. LY1275]|uniref:2-dehydropantoate 2-reductase n=1 Tax=Sphingosinicella sp. LY1275 TaxID=3095379 RepID=UPI002ADEE289|nr:2-dehydropantoate 2-reductase [Sphingosinicella sp. LY1275]MEA1015428.1 2-dehydropantoate 2-reductase [Sphingosinicella sp. LY1275]
MAGGPRIVVLGAGSVGCFVGGAWLAAGCQVSFVGRERVRAEIAEHGLGLSDQQGWRIHLAPDLIDFAAKLAALKKADIVALCVKSIGTEAAAKDIARHVPAGATVISFQNGISNADTLRALLPRHEVVQGMVPYNVVRLGPGRWHRATWGELTAARTDVTAALAAKVGDRPGRLLLSNDMGSVLWGKLLFNLNNAINALSGTTILEELGQRDYRRVMAAAIVETLELLDAAGIVPAKIGQVAPKLLPHVIGSPDFLFRNLFLRIQKIDPKARSSMSDDFAAGRQTEIDYLNGEVVRLAQRLGRKAPVNAAIVTLVKQAEAGVERTWSARELRDHVLGGHAVAGFGY